MNLTSFLESPKSNNPHYVLFGHPVEHSLSPMMHNTALDYYGLDAQYHAIDLQSNELSRLAAYLNRDTFLGANITIPYKQVIGSYLDDVDGMAQSIGAVNTIVKNEFRLEGKNTDLYGFTAPLESYTSFLEGHRAVVFGTGGASKAIVSALINLGMDEIYLVSRKPQRIHSYDDRRGVQLISYPEWPSYAEEAALIVNATPLGMYPKVDSSPVKDVEKDYLTNRICYDIVYNPIQTRFLRQAEAAGATTIGGLEMLIQQGSRSFEHWTGRKFPIENIRNLLYGEINN